LSIKEQLALQVLCALDIALFRRVGVKKYEFLGPPPAFYGDLFPPSGKGPCVEPWKHSSMLEIFFEEAELFFTNRKTGAFSSGIWQEEGKTGNDSALIAMSRIFDREQIVTIRLLQDDFNERAMILGKARAQLLENRALSRRLELYREKSELDGLTQLLNRATFMDSLPVEIRKAKSTDHPLSAIMLDIDDFKIINDTLGHITGDRVLQELSRLLRANLRQGDVVARYGGEEFIILLPACKLPKALTIAEKLRQIIECHMADDTPRFTVSMGCGLYQAGETPDDLIHRVDMALYEAKRNGKNQVCVC
jgi:diguanylate cyclase (GGDEF)-like protein